MISLFSKISTSLRENKSTITSDVLKYEANRLKSAIYDHFLLYALNCEIPNPKEVFQKQTRIFAVLTGESHVFFWNIYIDTSHIDPGTRYSIQIPSSETSSHLPFQSLLMIVKELDNEKFLRMYVHLNSAIPFAW